MPDCIETQILGTVGEVLDTALSWLSHPPTPVSGSRFHLGHLYFGVESGDSGWGRLVRSAKNQFIRGAEVGLSGLRGAEVGLV